MRASVSGITLLAGLLIGLAPQVANSGKPQTKNREQANQTNAPSLAETQRWIKNTFRENSGNSSCSEFDSLKRNSEFGRESECSYEKYSIEFEGCKTTLFTLHSHRNQTVKGKNWNLVLDEGDDKEDDSVVEFSLGEVDPGSVKAGNPRGPFGPLDRKTYHDNDFPLVEICLASTDAADTISLNYPYGRSHRTYKVHSLCGVLQPFVTVQAKYAPRFVTAFTHAVELCGGKPSAF